jgi:hypothetical protein
VPALDFVDPMMRRTGAAIDTDRLAEAAAARTSPTAMDLLQPGGPRRGRHNRRWHIIENSEVEADL